MIHLIQAACLITAVILLIQMINDPVDLTPKRLVKLFAIIVLNIASVICVYV